METTDRKLYTLMVYSDDTAGALCQITAVFARMQVSIESLNVSAPGADGLRKFTITARSDEARIGRITRLIEKKIGIIKACCHTDDSLFVREVGLYKISTPAMLANPDIPRAIREAGARVVEAGHAFSMVMLSGTAADVGALRSALDGLGCLSQWALSGRMAISRGRGAHEEPSHVPAGHGRIKAG